MQPFGKLLSLSLETLPAWEKMACQLLNLTKIGGVFSFYEKITATIGRITGNIAGISIFFAIFAPKSSASFGKWVLPPVVTTQNLTGFFSYFVTNLLLIKIYDYANI